MTCPRCGHRYPNPSCHVCIVIASETEPQEPDFDETEKTEPTKEP